MDDKNQKVFASPQVSFKFDSKNDKLVVEKIASKFCMECGTHFPKTDCKFCGECGLRRK
jgi:rRNA maturation endonuclease Nob1